MTSGAIDAHVAEGQDDSGDVAAEVKRLGSPGSAAAESWSGILAGDQGHSSELGAPRRDHVVHLEAQRANGSLFAVQQQLNAAATSSELLSKGSTIARESGDFGRAVMLAPVGGFLRADPIAVLGHAASDRLRRAILAQPVHLRAGSVEAEFIRKVPLGSGHEPIVATDSVLRDDYGLDEFVLGAVIPDDTVLAILVLERGDAPMRPGDQLLVERLALQISHALERLVMNQRVRELAAELRYLLSSSNALIDESLNAPIALSSEHTQAPSLGIVTPIAPGDRDGLRDLFTRREWTVATELIAGKSNREIAATLQLSPGTVKVYVSRVLKKLGAVSRSEAVARFHTLLGH